MASRRKSTDEPRLANPGGAIKAVPPLAPVGRSGGGGGFAPLAEVDMRTSIRPTIAQIDLGAINRNLERIAAVVGETAVWSVIKADGYGHGAVPVARAIAHRCQALAVSLVEEGLELRAAGLSGPIVVLGAYYDHCHAQVLEAGLIPVIYAPSDLESFSRAAARFRGAGNAAVSFDVHLKVDTGMSRLGISPDELPAVLDRAAAFPALRIAGLCTHFADADAPSARETEAALVRFHDCLEVAVKKGLGPLTNHAANSAATLRFPAARLDAVRPGLALYGAMPSREVGLGGLEPALKLITRVMTVRDVAAGTAVSYGGLWRASRPSRVATLPVGYADGYPRHVRSAEVLVRGRRAPVVGAVCMDMMMVDVTDVPGAEAEDIVTLIGKDGEGQITVDDLAAWAGTVNYEILCGISKRVPRIYKE